MLNKLLLAIVYLLMVQVFGVSQFIATINEDLIELTDEMIMDLLLVLGAIVVIFLNSSTTSAAEDCAQKVHFINYNSYNNLHSEFTRAQVVTIWQHMQGLLAQSSAQA